ncbi:MAG: hypothetical protein QOK43_2346 [Acidimicrobiaceae bacterium]|nr:hypothetical protein [Acidimicrobiaceae bacterium]
MADDLDIKQLQKTLSDSARAAGAKAVASGKWLTEWVVDNAPRIPVRDAATLSSHHDGLTGDALGQALIQAASRTTAAVGAAVGALAGVEELAPPAWLAIPFELVVETAAVAVVELKLVAELHEVYGHGIQGRARDKGLLIVQAWAERRGITPATAATDGGKLSTKAVREEVVRMARRRLVRRAGRNLSSLVPMFVGALAGAEANRRATRSVGQAVAADLRAP